MSGDGKTDMKQHASLGREAGDDEPGMEPSKPSTMMMLIRCVPTIILLLTVMTKIVFVLNATGVKGDLHVTTTSSPTDTSSILPYPAQTMGTTNRCSDQEFTRPIFDKGRACGAPFGSPCFNYSRCAMPSPDSGNSVAGPSAAVAPVGAAGEFSGPKIYVYDYGCSLSDSDSPSYRGRLRDSQGKPDQEQSVIGTFQEAAREAGVLAATYESACMFLHVSRADRNPCAVKAPLWNSGMNHMMVNFGDNGREGRPSVADSYAMDAASNMHSCLYRSGYDLSLPLSPKKASRDLAETAPLERRFFLTLKASVYLGGHGSEERSRAATLHDEKAGVFMSMRCPREHGANLRPENAEYCTRLEQGYEAQDYKSLMNTTFGLVPSGRSPSTFRLGEVMGAGAIPVFIVRDAVLPFREQLDWPSFSFAFTPDQVGPDMISALRAVPPLELEEMQRKSLEAYKTLWGEDDTLWGGPNKFGPTAKNVISILLDRIGHRGGR